MRKWMAGALAVVLMIGVAGCSPDVGRGEDDGAEEHEIETFESIDGFIEKYKRADFDELLDNPETFFLELNAAQSLTDLGTWDRNKDFDGWYEKDVVLFNYPVEATAIVFDGRSEVMYRFEIEMGEAQVEKEAARTICEYFFDEYGDASWIRVDGIGTTEKELRDCFLSNDAKVGFSCFWSSNQDDESYIDEDASQIENFDLKNEYSFVVGYDYFSTSTSEYSCLEIES